MGRRGRARSLGQEPAPRPPVTAGRPRERGSGGRPAAPWGVFPLTEIAIAIGVVAVVIGLTRGAENGGPAFIAGVGISLLAVGELVVREHFSGFRSHALLLAFMPVVAVHTAVALLTKDPTATRLAVLPEAILFGGLFVLLRRRFKRRIRA